MTKYSTLILCVCVQLYKKLNLNEPTAVPGVNKGQLIEDVAAALYASKICSYAQVRELARLEIALALLFLQLPALLACSLM